MQRRPLTATLEKDLRRRSEQPSVAGKKVLAQPTFHG
jgi:hypothetical protein